MDDPLANLAPSINGQRSVATAVHALAHQASGDRWLLSGGGASEHVYVAPGTWTHLLSEAGGVPLDPAARPLAAARIRHLDDRPDRA